MTDNNNENKFKNFAVFTADVSDVEIKEANSGTRYKVATATLTGLTYESADGGEYYPVIEVLVFGKSMKYLKAGQKVLTGSLSYSQYEDNDGNEVKAVKLIARSIKPRKEGDRERAFANLTVRVGKEVEVMLSKTTAKPWTNVRAALSMGKDDDDNYRPSLWLGCKAFSGKTGEHADFVYALGALEKNDYVDVKGGITVEEYKGQMYWGMFLNTEGIDYHDFGDGEAKSLYDESSIEYEEAGEALEAIPD